MKFFIDTAEISEVERIQKMGILDGITTNPSLIAKEGRDFKEVITEMSEILDGPISAEVLSEDAKGMVEEAEELAKIHENIVIKLPMTGEGLEATYELTKKGIQTNVTLIFTANQALMAAKAGATFVSPFLGRLDDLSQEGILLIHEIVEIFENYDLDSEIIVASIRSPLHVKEIALAGADIATIPPNVFDAMLKHPLTEAGIESFNKDWEEYIND